MKLRGAAGMPGAKSLLGSFFIAPARETTVGTPAANTVSSWPQRPK